MMRILAAVWGLIVCFVVICIVAVCATLKFPRHSTEQNVMLVAGVVIGVGLGINSYRKNSKPPAPPTMP